MKDQAFLTRLGFAMQGLRRAFRGEASFRFHCLATVGVFVVLAATRAGAVWWAVAALTIGLVFVAELFNTALETLADRLHPERHPLIGAAKDLAAGAVLVASIMALVVAMAFVLGLLSRP